MLSCHGTGISERLKKNVIRLFKGKSKDIVIQMSRGGERQTDFLAEKSAKKSLPLIFGTPFSYLYDNTLRL